MNGDGGTAVKQIIQAIENGTLPPDETQRRLMALIQKEANRTDGPADEEIISACMNLMERLQGRTYAEDEARTAALNQRIADAIQMKKQKREHLRIVFRAMGTIAAVVVLLVGIGVPLRWTWFESWSTPDEQQHVIMGHEIAVEMVAAAIAENTAKEPIVVSDFSEFEEHLGFDPGIPSVLRDGWVASHGEVQYFAGYIRVIAIYSNVTTDRSITCTVNYFTDVEYAHFSFEQTAEGEKETYSGKEIYLSNNIERNSATWYNHHMYVQIAGQLSSDEAIPLLLELIGEEYE